MADRRSSSGSGDNVYNCQDGRILNADGEEVPSFQQQTSNQHAPNPNANRSLRAFDDLLSRQSRQLLSATAASAGVTTTDDQMNQSLMRLNRQLRPLQLPSVNTGRPIGTESGTMDPRFSYPQWSGESLVSDGLRVNDPLAKPSEASLNANRRRFVGR